MNRTSRTSPILFLVAALAACTTTTAPGSAPPSPTSTPVASATPPSTAVATPSAEPTESADATPSPSMIEGEGGFTYEANAEADALMDETFSCQNLDDGYEVRFPAEWNANAEFGEVPPCSWFAPTEYETGAPGDVPDEIAIEIFVVEGDRGYHGDIAREDEGMIGATQPATRVEVTDGGETAYEYVVQLGPTPEEGPNLVARTSTEMGSDYALNRAILDRMMATMEFIGVIQ